MNWSERKVRTILQMWRTDRPNKDVRAEGRCRCRVSHDIWQRKERSSPREGKKVEKLKRSWKWQRSLHNEEEVGHGNVPYLKKEHRWGGQEGGGGGKEAKLAVENNGITIFHVKIVWNYIPAAGRQIKRWQGWRNKSSFRISFFSLVGVEGRGGGRVEADLCLSILLYDLDVNDTSTNYPFVKKTSFYYI